MYKKSVFSCFKIGHRLLFCFFISIMLERMTLKIGKILECLFANITIINIIPDVLLFDMFCEISFLCVGSIRTKWTFKRFKKGMNFNILFIALKLILFSSRFSPVCVRMCLVNLSFLKNFIGQNVQ